MAPGQEVIGDNLGQSFYQYKSGMLSIFIRIASIRRF